jgi:FixJ family two-component response regulator
MSTTHTGTRNTTIRAAIYVVDGDQAVRDGLCRLAMSAGCQAQAFANVDSLLAELVPSGQGCILLDSCLLQGPVERTPMLLTRRFGLPIIILCAGDDEATRCNWRKCGASFVLRKPVDGQALFDSIAWVMTNN